MADTNIKYNDHSISSAFKDHYIVPDYQREYVWDNEQVEQLLTDLLEAYEADNKKPYYFATFMDSKDSCCWDSGKAGQGWRGECFPRNCCRLPFMVRSKGAVGRSATEQS